MYQYSIDILLNIWFKVPIILQLRSYLDLSFKVISYV